VRATLITLALLAVALPFAASAHTYGANWLTGGTATADSDLGGGSTPDLAFDGNTATAWTSGAGLPHWLKYDLGVGVSHSLGMVTLRKADANYGKTVEVAWSDNGTTYTTSTYLYEEDLNNVSTSTEPDDLTPHRYYMFRFPDAFAGATYSAVSELTAYECTDCAATSTATSSAALSPADMLLTYLFYIVDALWWVGVVSLLLGGFYFLFFRK
jgi:hypothetical protein